MLCKTCEKLPLPTNVAGFCRKCSGNTSYFAYKLCDDCSVKVDQCERCEAPLIAGSTYVPTGATAFRITLMDKDNGSSRPGMHSGEEIVVVLEEDQYSQTEWGQRKTKSYGSIFRLKSNNGFTPYKGQYQKGTRELVFEVVSTGTEDLEMEEKVRAYSWYGSSPTPGTTPAPNGKSWKVSVQSN